MIKKKKKKGRAFLAILKGLKNAVDAADEVKQSGAKKRAWQKKDCGTPC